MKISTKQYVQVIFEESQRKNVLDRVINQLENTVSNLVSLKKFLENPKQSAEKKRQTLKSWKMKPLLINFLLILNKNKDLAKLNTILSELKNLRNEKTNTIEVRVETAKELTNKEKKQIIKSLKQKLAKKIILETQINPDLIGGVILKIGDKLIDNSLRNKLALLKQSLIG